MDILDVNFLIVLVLLDILITILFRWLDIGKPEPLTHLQYFLSQYDLKDEYDKMRYEDRKKLNSELFEAKLERKDIIRAIKKIKDEQ